jgi:hypothetical protein
MNGCDHRILKVFRSLILLMPLLMVGCGGSPESACPSADCGNYATQQEAQSAYDADKACLGELDADKDGVACEQLPSNGGGSGCPTTSNCGCSNKNKSDCGGPCCRWVVGTGCRCS